MGWEMFVGGLEMLGQLAYFIVGTFTAFYILTRLGVASAWNQSERIVADARERARTIVREAEVAAKEARVREREERERVRAEARGELDERDRQLRLRAESLEQRAEAIQRSWLDHERDRRELLERRRELDARAAELDAMEERRARALEEAAGLPREEARLRVLAEAEAAVRADMDRQLAALERRLRDEAAQRAARIVAIAVQRYAGAHVATASTVDVPVPSEEMKGRVIGREGRNIRAFEKATGVDLVVDDTPGLVTVSCFDPARRELARAALVRLVEDGRIHPARIEEAVAQARAELDRQTLDHARDAATRAGVNLDAAPDALVETFGRLRFRNSFAQNVLEHSIEVARLAGMIAAELGLDPGIARRAGLFHDLGKAVDQEAPGPHTVAGAEILRRAGERPEVVHAALAHHDEPEAAHPITAVVAAADALSAGRPGARRETVDRHVNRLETLEALALAFSGVEHAYAVQAGREIRVLVNAEVVDDHRAASLAREIARAVQDRGDAPGEVKVTVLRETRHVHVARNPRRELPSSAPGLERARAAAAETAAESRSRAESEPEGEPDPEADPDPGPPGATLTVPPAVPPPAAG